MWLQLRVLYKQGEDRKYTWAGLEAQGLYLFINLFIVNFKWFF